MISSTPRWEQRFIAAFELGRSACLSGKPLCGCPQTLDAESDGWECGWWDAQRQKHEAEARDRGVADALGDVVGAAVLLCSEQEIVAYQCGWIGALTAELHGFPTLQ